MPDLFLIAFLDYTDQKLFTNLFAGLSIIDMKYFYHDLVNLIILARKFIITKVTPESF